MIQPGYTPLNVGNNYSNVNYGNGANQGFQPPNGSHLDGNGGLNGSLQQQSDSGQQSQQSQQPEYSLAGVLHFLQTEWRRYERDRNEWEIERAEMRVSFKK
jgi:striatin 1/3/4